MLSRVRHWRCGHVVAEMGFAAGMALEGQYLHHRLVAVSIGCVAAIDLSSSCPFDDYVVAASECSSPWPWTAWIEFHPWNTIPCDVGGGLLGVLSN